MAKRAVKKHIIGVDEVGRGPLAGPVAVGAVFIYAEHYSKVSKMFPVVKDSKKLTAKSRDAWLLKIFEAEKKGFLVSSVQFVSSLEIDDEGIVLSIRKALARAIKKVKMFQSASSLQLLLDGGLRAPVSYEHQKTIIKGDEKELAVALASIVAKVARDRKMIKLSKKFPQYGFEKHKGYGTKGHYEAIGKYGITKHHRKSYLKKFI